MPSSNNNNNNNVNHYHNGKGQQHVGRSVAKRKFNELANVGLPAAAAGGKQIQHQRAEKLSKKNRAGQQGNHAFENLHLEKLSREELIQLVRKLLLERNEAQATTEKEAEESAKQEEIVQLEQGMAELHVDLLKKMALEISTIMADLPPPAGRHRKLPAELNCQIFYCLNLPTRRKFIGGLGWDFYAMFRHRLLTKIKRVCNPRGNCWDGTNTRAVIRADGLNASNKIGYTNIMAEQPFPIFGPHCRMDEFPGKILYYYEVKGRLCNFGFTDCHDFRLGGFYVTPSGGPYYYECWLGGESHDFQLPEGAFPPRMKKYGNVYGCGLVIDPKNKLAIFFTLNGQLIGQKIPISPSVDCLFPAVTMMSLVSSIEANFGNDWAKSFEYDIKNCPGLELACI